MKTFELLLALLSSECFGESLKGDIIGQIDGDKLLEIYNISKAHDVSHIVGSALSKNNNALISQRPRETDPFSEAVFFILNPHMANSFPLLAVRNLHNFSYPSFP